MLWVVCVGSSWISLDHPQKLDMFLQHTFSTTYISYAVLWSDFHDFPAEISHVSHSEVPTSLRAGKGPKSELSSCNPEVPFKRLAEWPQWMTLVDLKTWESVQYIVVLDKNTIQVMSYVAGSLFPSSKSLPSPLPHGGFCAALCDPGWKVQLRKVSRTYNLVNIWPIHIQMLQWNMRDMDRLKLKMFFGIWNLRHIIHPAIALMAKWSVIIATWNILVIGHGRLLQMFLPKNPCKTEVLWVHHCFVDGSQPKMATFWARWMTCSDANRGSFRCRAKFIELLMLDT